MNQLRTTRFFLFLVLASLFVLFSMSSWIMTPETAVAHPLTHDTPADQLAAAWEMVQQSNTYTFDTHIEQTSYPVPALSNVGRQPQTDDLYLNGQRDQAQDLLEITVWQNARGDENSGLAVRSQNGRSFRRNAAGEWEEHDGVGDLFAPGGDPLTFIQTAKNIEAVGSDSRQLGDLTFQYETYRFDLDTSAYAQVMRRQLEAQMAQYGRLPAGLTLQTPDLYRQMTGTGQLWLDDTGLPRRLEMTLEIPPQADQGRVTARIVTDLSGFDRDRIEQTAVPFWQSPQTWMQARQLEIAAGVQQGMETAVWLIVAMGLILFVITTWRSHRFYTAVVSVIILSMLSSPLLQVVQASDFQANLQTAQAKADAQQAEAAAQSDLQTDLATTNWNPHQNPLASPEGMEATQYAIRNTYNPNELELTAANTITDTTDTDGDGLIDLDEARWGSCPYLGAPTGCAGVSDPTDSDGDTLSDGVEVHELGTHPVLADTDGDSIDDNVEINSFTYAGKDWYLNPLEEDSNKDGLIDGLECRTRTTIVPADFDPLAICPDSDMDGEPDLFDTDNDGDGVPDAQDASPFVVSADFYDQENPLALSIDNLELDKPVFVDLQFRPQTGSNLNLYNHVLDWPSMDTEGQIQRFLDTTFADTDNLELRSDSANAANGDIRLVPMLEVTMPYTDGHYANLPITTTAPLTRTLGDPVDSWLDNAQLDPMGISVNDLDVAAGSLNAYLPLTQVQDRYGTPHAFAARMLYQPTQGENGRVDWGAAHEYRLVWMVQIITDECPDGYEELREEVNGTMTYTCVHPQTQATAERTDVLTIGHIYPETWQLTGLTISEEHDFDMAILYEDPALDTDLTADDQLMVASWNLSTGFMIGRDCETKDGNGVCQGNGSRDVTVANMATSVSSWFTDTYYINVDTFLDYDHSAYQAYIIGTEVQPILDTEFASYTNTIPTFMYVQDQTNRELNLDDWATNSSAGLITFSGNALTINVSPAEVPVQVKSSMSWTPYQYVDGSWRAAEIDAYLTQLDGRLQQETLFQPADESEAAAEDAANLRLWIQTYYASLWLGLTAWTELAGQPLNARSPNPNIPDAEYDPFFTPGTDYGATVLALKVYDALLGSTTLVFSRAGIAGLTVLVLITWAAVALMIAGEATGNNQLTRIGEIVLASLTLVIGAFYVMQALVAFSNSGSLLSFTGYKAIGSTGVAITLAVVWGFFLYNLFTKDMSGLAINVALSIAIATTLFIIVLFILSAVGLGILGILLFMVDAIFLLLGKKGPTQYIIEGMSNALFDIDMSVTNLSAADRLDMQVHEVGFLDAQQGFRETNTLLVTMGITNTIKYHRTFRDDEERVAKRNVFTYTLQLGNTTFENGLAYWDDTATDQWTPLSGRKLQTNYENSLTVPLSSVGAGLNQPLGLNYTESFLTGAKTCWGIGNLESCNWKNFRDAIHYPLSSMMVFDIFPATVAEFAAMNWSDNAALALPDQVDRDMDGLPDGQGTDPSNVFDGDGDGLGDLFEITNGYNALIADGDFDGLNDFEELYWGTNPFLEDTDGDGLNDRIETVEGWLVVYNGNQRIRVWSDPLSIDADEDGLSDLEEFVFGFNPWTPTDPSLITQLVQFDNLGVTEMGAPELLLQFEDDATSTTFYDSSGEGHHASCVGDACPMVSQNGRYAQAPQFDGTDDYLETPAIIDPAATTFTAAAWFKLDSHSNEPVLLQQLDGSGNGRSWLRVMTDGTIQTYLGNSPLNTISTVSDGQWHHAALVYDGATAQLYLDGALENSALRTAEANDGGLWLGRHKFIATAYLDGMLDDVVILDQALDVDGIGDVMNGRFNPNDNLLAPNTNLQYHATVTNTSATTATGFLVGENSYFDPSLRHPAAAYNFEPENRLRAFANNTGDDSPILCTDDGTCPAIISSVYEQGLWFNGTTHTALLPALSVKTINDNFNLSFWVNLDAYPPVGERMMLVDTDSDQPGAIDIYINSSGNVVVDVAGHPDGPSVDSRVLDLNNNHISLNGHFQLFINSSPQFLNNWSIDPPDSYQIGPGKLGTSLDGADLPFYGQIDDLAFFDDFKNSSQVSAIQGGNYNGHIALYRFRYDTVSHGYDNLANDVRAATCPGFTPCPGKTNGRYGSGILLDGVEDYLTLDTPVDPAVEPFTAALWFTATGYSNAPIFLQQADGNGTGRTWLGIRSDGRLYSFLGGSYLNSATPVMTDTWHHAAVTYDGTTLRLYLDGVEEASDVRTMEASDGEMELGRHPTIPGRYFNGRLDELVMLKTAVTADKVQLLMNSSWPMIDVLDEFVPYSAAALSTQFVSGLAPVNPHAATSQHRFDQEVEAALVLQTEINYPIVDPYASDLQLFIPFEDGPGSQVIDNLIPYPNPGYSPDREAYCLQAAHCPTLGLRGQVERAAYFDGRDDYLFLDTNIPGGYGPGAIRTVSTWVNAEAGTIFDLRFGSTSYWFTLNMDYLEIFNVSTLYTIPYDLPRNEWFHLAVTIDDSDVGHIYVNGVEIASGPADPIVDWQKAWGYIGSARQGNNLLQGYLDDLRMYDVPLSTADVVNLYETSAPLMRFEFDEDEAATVFIDNSVNEYVGQPRQEHCAALTLDTLSVNNLANSPATVFVDLDGTRLMQTTGLTATDTISPAVESLLCGQQTLQVGVVVSGSVTMSGTAVLNSNTPGSVNQIFTGSGNAVTLDWTVDDKPVYQPSPAPGTKGRIANGALFDGQSYIQIDNADDPAALTNDFTIMGWIRPQTVGAGIERLFGAGNEATVNGYNIALDNSNLLFQTNGVQQYLSGVTIEPDRWQHIAVVFDSNNDAHFYLDGEFQQTMTGTSPANANTDDPLFIGARTDINGNIIQSYTGMIDELAVYGRSLTEAELFGIYLRELRWYRDKATTYLTIDTDAPTIELLSDAAYWPNGYIQLAVATTDTTSAVTLLDFGLKAPGAAEFSWQGAIPCAESSARAAWCPYFDSSQLSGEGTYELQFRAVDAVGNETLSSVYTLYVDDTPPTAVGNYNGQWVQPTMQDDDELRWTVTLSGTLNDPDLATVPPVAGSGVVTESVMVELVDGVNGRFNNGPQSATINGSNWSIDYEMSGLRPQGTYTIALTLEDEVGNDATLTIGTIKLDERPPLVDLNSWNLPDGVISQTLVLSGTAHDLPDWGSSVVEHHFEEPAGTAVFYNTAASQFYTVTHSTCITCPTAGLPGLFGSGVQFDGVNDRIDVPFAINPATETFAASVWIQVTDLSNQRIILQQLDGAGAGRSWLYVIGGNGKIQSNLGGVLTTANSVALGEWHHVALTYDGTTLYLYLDGRLEASAPRTPEWTDGALQLGMLKGGGSFFAGMMDEFTLYDRFLSAEEVYALAQRETVGVTAVDITLMPASFVTDTLSVPSNHATATIAPDSYDWQYPLPAGLEDFYEIHLNGRDAFDNQGRDNMVWRGLIDTVAPVITATGQHKWSNNVPVTKYTFTFSDIILDDSSYLQPCALSDLKVQTYNDANLPHDGLPYKVSAACQVAGHETSRDFAVCDSVGHCTTVTVIPDAAHTLTINKETTTDARLTWTQPGGYCGYGIHRSSTPYFVPDLGTEIDTVGGGIDNYLLVDGLLTTRFYTIMAAHCVSGTAVANEVGVFLIPITPGN